MSVRLLIGFLVGVVTSVYIVGLGFSRPPETVQIPLWRPEAPESQDLLLPWFSEDRPLDLVLKIEDFRQRDFEAVQTVVVGWGYYFSRGLKDGRVILYLGRDESGRLYSSLVSVAVLLDEARPWSLLRVKNHYVEPESGQLVIVAEADKALYAAVALVVGLALFTFSVLILPRAWVIKLERLTQSS